MPQRDDRIYIKHMIDTANKAIGFVIDFDRKEFDSNELLRLSLTHLLQVIGEAARRISPEFRSIYPTIPWKAIVGMRSKVVHDYLDVDEDVVWSTVKNDLPFIVSELLKIIDFDDPRH
jgi:uncharacterized protein with HEPN domain